MYKLRLKVASLILIAVFAFSLANTQVVLADDVNPPTETPTEPAPPPEGGEGETTTLPEVLEQAPAGTGVVITDAATGETLPLATQAAALALATADPIWCPEGNFPGDVECLDNGGAGYASLADLLTALAGDPSAYSDAGTIYLEAGDLADTADVMIDQAVLGLTDLIIQGGWNGAIDSTWAIDPTTPSIFNGIGLSIASSAADYWAGNITLNDLVIQYAIGNGLVVDSTGDIAVSNVDVNEVGLTGATLETTGTYVDGTGEVSVTDSTFTGNPVDGLVIVTPGDVTLDTVTASGNVENGARIESGGAVRVEDSQFNENGIQITDPASTYTLDEVPGNYYHERYDMTYQPVGSGLVIGPYEGSNAGDVTLAGNLAGDNYLYGVLVDGRSGNLFVDGDHYIGNGSTWVREFHDEYLDLWNPVTGEFDRLRLNTSWDERCAGAGLYAELEGNAELSGVQAGGNCSYGASLTLGGTADISDSVFSDNSGMNYQSTHTLYEDPVSIRTHDTESGWAEGAGLYVQADEITLWLVTASANANASGAELAAGTGGVNIADSWFNSNRFFSGTFVEDRCSDPAVCESDSYYSREGNGGTGLLLASDGPVELDGVYADGNGDSGAIMELAGALHIADSEFSANGSAFDVYSRSYDYLSVNNFDSQYWVYGISGAATGLGVESTAAITLENVIAAANGAAGASLINSLDESNADITIRGGLFGGNGGYTEGESFRSGYDSWSERGYEFYSDWYIESGFGLQAKTLGIATLTDVVAADNYGYGALVLNAQQALVTGGEFNGNGAADYAASERTEWPDAGGTVAYWSEEYSEEGYGLMLVSVPVGVITDVDAMYNSGYGLGFGAPGLAGSTLSVSGGVFSFNTGWYEFATGESVAGTGLDYFETESVLFQPGAGIGVVSSPGAVVSLQNVVAVENAVAGALLDDSFSLLDVTGGSFDYNYAFYEYEYYYEDDGIIEETGEYLILGDGIVTGSGYSYLGGLSPHLLLLAEPSGGVTITGSTATGNQRSGFYIEGAAPVLLSYVTATDNGQAGATIVASAGQPAVVMCSTLSMNGEYGAEAYMNGGTLSLHGLSFWDNGVQDVYVEDGMVVYGPCVSEEEWVGDVETGEQVLPYQYVSVPTLGGEADLNCSEYGGTVIELPYGDRIILPCPVKDTGVLHALTTGNLPAALPPGAYLAGMDARVSRHGQDLERLDGSMIVSFKLTEDLQKLNLAILYWDPQANNRQGGWVELPARVINDGLDRAFPLHDPFDRKMIFVGSHPTDKGYFEVEVNFTGIFVLVRK